MMHDPRLPIHVALLSLVLIAAVTDLRTGKVFNVLTGPGMVLGLALNAALAPPVGLGIGPALLGLLTGGGLLLLAYLAGGIGGGDVKLLGVVGAFLGPRATLVVLLYTFVVAAAMSLFLIVVREGPRGLLRRLHDLGVAVAGGRATSGGDGGVGSAGRAGDLRVPFAVAVLAGVVWHAFEVSLGASVLPGGSGL